MDTRPTSETQSAREAIEREALDDPELRDFLLEEFEREFDDDSEGERPAPAPIPTKETRRLREVHPDPVTVPLRADVASLVRSLLQEPRGENVEPGPAKTAELSPDVRAFIALLMRQAARKDGQTPPPAPATARMTPGDLVALRAKLDQGLEAEPDDPRTDRGVAEPSPLAEGDASDAESYDDDSEAVTTEPAVESRGSQGAAATEPAPGRAHVVGLGGALILLAPVALVWADAMSASWKLLFVASFLAGAGAWVIASLMSRTRIAITVASIGYAAIAAAPAVLEATLALGSQQGGLPYLSGWLLIAGVVMLSARAGQDRGLTSPPPR